MQVNKVQRVKTITRVAEDFGEDKGGRETSPVTWRSMTASSASTASEKMGSRHFIDLGIENLIELVCVYKENPTWLKRRQSE